MPTPRRQKAQHGGARQGKPGGAYPNRSDMRQAPRAAPGQEYGQAKAQMDAQNVVPLSKVPAPGVRPSPLAAGGGGGSEVIPLSAPTTRPNEPITAGLNGGPGPGPEALNLPPTADDDLMAWLQAAYRANPNDDLARLMASVDARMDKPTPLTLPTRSKGQAIGNTHGGQQGFGSFVSGLMQNQSQIPDSGVAPSGAYTEGTGGLGPNNAGVMG